MSGKNKPTFGIARDGFAGAACWRVAKGVFGMVVNYAWVKWLGGETVKRTGRKGGPGWIDKGDEVWSSLVVEERAMKIEGRTSGQNTSCVRFFLEKKL